MQRPDLSHRDPVTLVGGGPVGALLSIILARRGIRSRIHERRPDMRRHAISAGRSINLALSTRGIRALEEAGISAQVLSQAVPMFGRMMHSPQGELTFQRYGMDDSQYINSVSRGGLNQALLTQAEKTGLVEIEFDQRVTAADLDQGWLELRDEKTGATRRIETPVLIGTDGSASAIRTEMMKRPGYSSTETALEYGYKELTLPAAPGGAFQIEKNALHIWPRGNFMLIALPNFDGSFTCTLFLPFHSAQPGAPSFDELTTPGNVQAFFEREFPDATRLLPDLTDTFFAHPTGQMVTVKCSPWNVAGRALLVGDAAHAIVPFYGQGMNCGFEDCTLIGQMLDRQLDRGLGWEELFTEFSRTRKADSDAIADMAIDNFVEMRDRVGDPRFLFAKSVEKILQAKFPGDYLSRYSLVTFSQMPYRIALEAGAIEEGILGELCQGIEKPEQVNLEMAARLIQARLAPTLKKGELTHGSRTQG